MAAGITLQDFKLTGDLGGDAAAFTLTANAKVEDSQGGALQLLSGPVALTSLSAKQTLAHGGRSKPFHRALRTQRHVPH